jgi:hypothetical protein
MKKTEAVKGKVAALALQGFKKKLIKFSKTDCARLRHSGEDFNSNVFS